MITPFFFFVSTTIMIVMWCLGLRAITDKDMILYGLREPFEPKPATRILTYEQFEALSPYLRNGCIVKTDRTVEQKYMIPSPFWSKPVIICIWCMPSVWGTIIYGTMVHFSPVIITTFEIYFYWVMCCVSASFWAGFFWNLSKSLKK